jgi:oxygen-independent coproporphyrinogen-3 oxidase
MLNALRLNDGFSHELFEARTGLDPVVIEARVHQLQERGLLVSDNRGVRASPLGRRFLDTVISAFFPD